MNISCVNFLGENKDLSGPLQATRPGYRSPQNYPRPLPSAMTSSEVPRGHDEPHQVLPLEVDQVASRRHIMFTKDVFEDRSYMELDKQDLESGSGRSFLAYRLLRLSMEKG